LVEEGFSVETEELEIVEERLFGLGVSQHFYAEVLEEQLEGGQLVDGDEVLAHPRHVSIVVAVRELGRRAFDRLAPLLHRGLLRGEIGGVEPSSSAASGWPRQRS